MSTTIRIGRLTVHPRPGSGRDVAVRLRAESLLGSLDLTPPGFGDRAVLVVRRIQLRADRRLPQTARSTVESLRRTASRAGPGVPPDPGAPAVLFADEAELLACMTRDALRGELNRWYWRQLVPARSARVGAVLAAAWTARVRWLPAALAALPVTEAARAVATLSPTEAGYVRRVLLSEYAATGYEVADGPVPRRRDLPDRWTSVIREGPCGAPVTLEPAPAREAVPVERSVPVPPWRPWLPATVPALPPVHEALLGVALALYSAPVIARRAGFRHGVEAWVSTVSPPRSSQGGGEALATVVSAPIADPPRFAVLPATAPPDGVATTIPDSDSDARPDPQPAGAASARAVRHAAGEESSGWNGGVPSRAASALLLVNILAWLDLPAAWPDGAAPGGWAILELLARHLLGPDTVPDDDPLWTVLAELDGREPATAADPRIGTDDPVRLPTAWLHRWTPAPADWTWDEHTGRLVIADRARGYVVADVPCPRGLGTAVAETELARLRAAAVRGSLRAGQIAKVSDRWGAAVGRFVAWLLADREVSAAALAQPGRIIVTRTHVDVVLDLDRVDLAARISGLDRDPGWVPDLRRVVAFHFEAGAGAC